MRKILLLLIAMSFISCTQTQKAVYQQEETYTQEDRNFSSEIKKKSKILWCGNYL